MNRLKLFPRRLIAFISLILMVSGMGIFWLVTGYLGYTTIENMINWANDVNHR